MKSSFEKFLKRAALDGVRHARRLVEETEDEDLFADEGEEDADEGDEGKDKPEKDASEEAENKKSGRGGPQQAKAATRDVPAPDADDLNMEMITGKLNAIRSGPSFKDQGVQQRIGQYFQSLNITQRLALYAFLEGLAEVIAADVSGEDARQPDDPEYAVKMDRVENEETRERKADTPAAPRIAKPETEEYSDNSTKRKVSQDALAVERDADEDAPVMVVRR